MLKKIFLILLVILLHFNGINNMSGYINVSNGDLFKFRWSFSFSRYWSKLLDSLASLLSSRFFRIYSRLYFGASTSTFTLLRLNLLAAEEAS